ncbi:MAG: lpxA [Burkholderiaceae bacterium]|nr:lpxA [Burkholderiaceae bacterium]
MANIHPTALIDPQAELDSSVTVGAYSVIGPNVRIGAGTRIGPHVVIEGHTTIGRDNNIFQFASLGGMPQDKKYAGEPTRLEIGDRNTIREFCTFNTGSIQDQGVTILGNDNWMMAYVHIAHDCVVGSNTIFANSTTLGGHVHIGDWAILGGATLVHQFCQIGAHVMAGGGTVLTQDVPPFLMITGAPPAPHGINSEGLRRRGFTPEQIADLRNAYKTLYRSGLSLEEAKAELAKSAAEAGDSAPHINQMRTFLDGVTRGIVR